MIVSKQKYRLDIQGLRGVAVLAVFLNHLNSNILQSGFLGVDIFFVISGFVITGSLERRINSSTGPLLRDFFQRRIKRIIPPLLSYIAITILLFSFVVPDPLLFVQSARWALVGFSNIYFYRNATDYFSIDASVNPYLQTWSLGVEEQFYLVYPLLFILFRKRSNTPSRLIGVLSVLSIMSFLSLVLTSAAYSSPGYFLTQNRAWEICIGAISFYITANVPRYPLKLIFCLRSLSLSVMLVVMICSWNNIPMASAVITSLTSILLIISTEDLCSKWLLCNKPILYIGTISYSLYLWHWGIISLFKWIDLNESIEFILAILLSLCAAHLSCRTIEQAQILNLANARQIFSFYGITMSISLAVLPAASTNANKILYLGDQSSYKLDRRAWRQPGYSQESSNLNQRKILVLGNSHAGDLLPLIQRAANDFALGYSIYVTGSRPVPFVDGIWKHINHNGEKANLTTYPYDKNEDTYKRLLNKSIDSLNKNDLLILSSRHFSAFDKPFWHNGAFYLQVPQSTSYQDDSSLQYFVKSLNSIISRAAERGAKTIFFLPRPEFKQSPLSPELCQQTIFRQNLPVQCFLSTGLYHEKLKLKSSHLQALHNLSAKYKNTFYLYDPLPALCDLEQGLCHNYYQYKRFYSDDDHLSERGAIHLYEASFKEYLTKLFDEKK